MKFTTFMMRVWLIICAVFIIGFAVIAGTDFIHVPIIVGAGATILLYLFYKLIDNYFDFDYSGGLSGH
jgi:hypothetical protein